MTYLPIRPTNLHVCVRLDLGFVKAVLTANYPPAGVAGFYVALEDERFPARLNFPGALSCFNMFRAASRAHPVNSHVECVRTIKKMDHRKHVGRQKKVSGCQLRLALALTVPPHSPNFDIKTQINVDKVSLKTISISVLYRFVYGFNAPLPGEKGSLKGSSFCPSAIFLPLELFSLHLEM